MKISDVVKIFKDHRPMNRQEAEKIGLSLYGARSGSFRSVYRIRDTDLVVKFAVDGDGIDHNIAEAEACFKILNSKKLKPLHRYMPKIYRSSEHYIVMKYYRPMTGRDISRASVHIMRNMVEDFGFCHPDYGTDLHWRNLGFDTNDQIKFLDMGGIVPKGK